MMLQIMSSEKWATANNLIKEKSHIPLPPGGSKIPMLIAKKYEHATATMPAATPAIAPARIPLFI
jgi:hypothetical protein